MSSYFVNTAVNFAPSLLATVQSANNLYGGNYGGLENYFAYIRNYFGQGLYDQITAGFMQQSSVYTDSLRLEEWHLYGSSRIGIYQTNKAMAQRTVRIENGITTQLSNTHIEQLGRVALLCIHTERGAKRYELTNHLGNVLTVVTDKKLPVCSSNSITYFIVDIVSATDYSPFGAPLAGRTWQGGEYRYGFNGKEKDDETYGGGNAYDFGARIYDCRLGRFMTKDFLSIYHPDLNPYHFTGNSPLFQIDYDGNDYIISISKDQSGKTVLTISTTVYAVGASKLMVEEMNRIAGQIFQKGESNGVIIQFNLKFVAVNNESEVGSNMCGRKIGRSYYGNSGNNILYFGVRAKRSSTTSVSFSKTSNTGFIDSRKPLENQIWEAVHETGHLIGLSDRYKDYEDLDGCEISMIDNGFEGDLYGNYGGNKFSQSHRENYVNFYKTEITSIEQNKKSSLFQRSSSVVDKFLLDDNSNNKAKLKGSRDFTFIEKEKNNPGLNYTPSGYVKVGDTLVKKQ